METTRLLIVDDHTIFREGLVSLLQSVAGIEVVGEAGDGAQAVTMAERLLPDVILMDVVMPELNGIAATQRILSQDPTIGVIMLTMLEDDETLFAAMCAGARGYLVKGSGKAEALNTIRAVAQGSAVFGPSIAARLSRFFQDDINAHADDGPFPELTDREREVLELIAGGDNNPTIAERLHISPKTVGNHISNIFNKLQVSDRAQAIVKARSAGLGSGENRV